MKPKLILCLVLVLSGDLFGCSTTPTHPSGLPLRYHNAKYDFTFFLPADWKGYSVLMKEWNSELESADYQKVIGIEHGPMIVLRNPKWKADEPYQDIPVLVFTRSQWNFVKPERLNVGAAGSDDEISRNAKFVFAINSHAIGGWDDALKNWHATTDTVIVNRNFAVLLP